MAPATAMDAAGKASTGIKKQIPQQLLRDLFFMPLRPIGR
jgi:hypothetical protein